MSISVRSMFIPDPGYILLDCDLAGADAQVVAWEANDEDLMAAFRAGLKVHAKNALDMFGPDGPCGPDGKREPTYSKVKRAVHGTNYGAKPPTMAATTGWSLEFCAQFQARWFHLHPAILAWHRAYDRRLRETRVISNAFGFRRTYFDRDSLTEALAWVPQSTIAIVCNRGGRAVRADCPWVVPLLQVHDSLVFQIKREDWGRRHLIHQSLLNPVPYPQPLLINWGLKASAKSWGHVKSVSWDGDEPPPE